MSRPSAVFPIASALIASALVACSGQATTPTTVDSVSTTAPAPLDTTPATTVPVTTTLPTAESLPAGWALAARADGEVDVYRDAGDTEPFTTLSPTTDLGTPRVVLILEGPIDGWARASIPVRPNGTEGWIRTDGLTLFTTDRSVDVDLGEHRLELWVDGAKVLSAEVAIGKPSHPTPEGRFFITDSVRISTPSGPWGPFAFGLSAYSDVVTEMYGSEAVVGIHGTNVPSSIGQDRSLGCIRVANDVILELSNWLSAGVPVDIHR